MGAKVKEMSMLRRRLEATNMIACDTERPAQNLLRRKLHSLSLGRKGNRRRMAAHDRADHLI
jgi:hypothetical protein